MKRDWIRPTIGAVVVGVVAALSMAVPAPRAAVAAPEAAPVRNDSVNEPVYFIHGFDAEPDTAGVNCNDYWGDAIDAMQSWGWTGFPVTVGYYLNDDDCTDSAHSGGRFTPLREIGAGLAYAIYERYSIRGVSVDVVAHSMGGLIIRDALTGVQEGREGYPPYLYVEDVVTLSTPHSEGSVLAGLCAAYLQLTQCKDMAGLTPFLESLGANPQGAHGTDWTVVGYESDHVVPEDVATAMRAKHQVIYASDQHDMDHDNMRWKTAGTWTHKWSNDYGATWTRPTGNQASPVRVANNGCYWHSAW